MADNPRIEELRRRVQLDPASIAFAALAEEFRRMGRHDEAIETCRAGLQRHPAYLSARVTLGRALIETGDYDGAREELETVLRSAPENLAATRGLAQIHERLGHSTEMDPHLAAMMNAEVERISLAAIPPPAPPPAAVVEAAAELVVETASAPVLTIAEPAPPVRLEPEPEPEGEVDPQPESEPEPVFVQPVEAPDPAMLATLARLERFLVAIDAARHP
jgi:tetratricopeptide (TPR) repeat protein